MLLTQHNARIHLAATVVAIAAGLFAHLARFEWAILILCIASVWTAEAVNTALEFLCDVASPEFHPLVEKAKDVAAAAVLVTAISALAVGVTLFYPHVFAMP
jgi:diacylglycerol kinase (ATP)